MTVYLSKSWFVLTNVPEEDKAQILAVCPGGTIATGDGTKMGGSLGATLCVLEERRIKVYSFCLPI